jgi:hypothetical protein
MVNLIDETGWFDKIKKKKKPLLSELDTLLRGVVRFFNIENLLLEGRSVADRNFRTELIILRDTLHHLLSIIEIIIPEKYKNAFWFQKYAEQSFLSDHSRDRLKESLIRQETPEKSLLLLYDFLVNLKVIIQGLLNSEKVTYTEFKNLGDLIERQIRDNLFFDPFKKEPHPEYDRIYNKTISTIVKSIEDKSERRFVSTLMIYLFRCLRFLGYIDQGSYHSASLHYSLVILVLLQSEIRTIMEFIKEGLKRLKDKELQEIVDSIGFQLTMESKRVFKQELKNVLDNITLNSLKGKIETSQGILRNLIEQCILQIIKYYNPEVRGETIFPGFTTRLEQSLKLREDIYVLLRLTDMLESEFKDKEKRRKFFEALKSYMLYFQSFTFRLLRHDDYEEFERFFNKFLVLTPETIVKMDQDKILSEIHRFKVFLETTIKMVSQREELKGKEIDIKKAEEIIAQFLPDLKK